MASHGDFLTNVRLQDALFEPATPREAKAQLRAAAPAGTTILIYKSASEFNAVVRSKKELDWIQSELRSIGALASSSDPPNSSLTKNILTEWLRKKHRLAG